MLKDVTRTVTTKKEDDLDDGWKITRSKMKDLENKVKLLQVKMNKLRETYSNTVVAEYECTIDDKEESIVEKEDILINQDYSDVTLACAEDKTISAHKVVLVNSYPDISSVTLVCDEENEKIFAHKFVLTTNIQFNKEELQHKNALLYKGVFLQVKGRNTLPSSSVKEPDIISELPMFQFGDGDLSDAEIFLQRPPPSPPYSFPPSPPQYEGSPGHLDYGHKYGGQVQDTQCYYRRGGQCDNVNHIFAVSDGHRFIHHRTLQTRRRSQAKPRMADDDRRLE